MPSAATCASARSTKITPRASTCRPNQACIPVSTRPARKGQKSSSTMLLERGGQAFYVDIEKRNVIVRSGLRAYGRQQRHRLGAAALGDLAHERGIRVGIGDHQADAGIAHALEQRRELGRRGRGGGGGLGGRGGGGAGGGGGSG